AHVQGDFHDLYSLFKSATRWWAGIDLLSRQD
ncbi:MAG: hypothetical protein ACI856_001154, partial [Kiritimatiellia bacterium]